MRREFDEDTGRVRLIKGDGEVLEECVSRLDHNNLFQYPDDALLVCLHCRQCSIKNTCQQY